VAVDGMNGSNGGPPEGDACVWAYLILFIALVVGLYWFLTLIARVL